MKKLNRRGIGPIKFMSAWVVFIAFSLASGAYGWVRTTVGTEVGGLDSAAAMARDTAGNIIVVGTLENAGTGSDVLALKLDFASGVELWRVNINGTAGGDDQGYALAIDQQGDVLICGALDEGPAGDDLVVIKVSGATGAEVWRYRFNGAANLDDLPAALSVDPAGDVLVTGLTENGDDSDLFVAKLAGNDGVERWRRVINGPGNLDDEGRVILADSTGDVLVVWTSQHGEDDDIVVLKLSRADGSEAWRHTVGSTADSDDAAVAAALDGAGRLILAATVESDDGQERLIVASLAGGDGTQVWRKTIGDVGNNEDSAVTLGIDPQGDVVVAGSTEVAGTDQGDDILVTRLSAENGAQVWRQTFNGRAHGDDSVAAIGFSTVFDTVVLAGASENPGNGTDLILLQFQLDSGNGCRYWDLDGTSHGYDIAVDLTIVGNKIGVTGGTENSGSATDVTVALVDSDGWPSCEAEPPASCTFLTTWGSYGSGPGQFSFPWGMAVDGSGNIFVADTFNNRIQKFDGYGTFLTMWGSSGSGPGQFNLAKGGVAVDGSGNVFVADPSNNRIQKFDSSGAFLTMWGSNGGGPGQFGGNYCCGPFELAVDASGNVFAADTLAHRIQKFDSNGTFLTTWGSNGTGAGQFGDSPYGGPTGVAVDGSGSVFVTDPQHYRIQKFDSNGTFLTMWGSSGVGPGQFGSHGPGPDDGSPYELAVDGSGNVFVADRWNYRIQKFDSNGTFLTMWGSNGNGTGQFDYPQGVAVDGSGNVFVSDTNNELTHNRIQKFACSNCAASGPVGQLLQTGQTTCTDAAGAIVNCAGTGQDGEFRKGLSRAFVDNGDGTVTDTRTGFVWEKLSDDGTVHDQDNSYSWNDAFAKIATLNSTHFAGYSDWRLPNINELYSLVNWGTADPAAWAEFNAACTPGCAVTNCSCTNNDGYANVSSTTDWGQPYFRFLANMSTGNLLVGYPGGVNGGGVRGVRGPEPAQACSPVVELHRTAQTTCWDSAGSVVNCAGTGQDGELQKGLAPTYVDNGDGTIVEPASGLLWEKLSDDGTVHDQDNSYSWNDAFAKIATLNSTHFAGYSDWRLPNINELFSLASFQASDPGDLGEAVWPAFNTGCTPGCGGTTCSCNAPTEFFWSSSALYPEVWGIYFSGYPNISSFGMTDTTGRVRAVRGG